MERPPLDEKQKFFQRSVESAEYWGYPPGCNIQWTDEALVLKKISVTRSLAGNFTGFIPCDAHAESIVNGEITLESLILPTRKAPYPFPNDKGIDVKKPKIRSFVQYGNKYYART